MRQSRRPCALHALLTALMVLAAAFGLDMIRGAFAREMVVGLVLLCYKNQVIMRPSSTNVSRRRWTREWNGSRLT
jgi:hypothetical protein